MIERVLGPLHPPWRATHHVQHCFSIENLLRVSIWAVTLHCFAMSLVRAVFRYDVSTMKAHLQRVSEATVTVDGNEIASSKRGYLILLGVLQGDTKKQAEELAEKITKLRLFDGPDGRINDRSIVDIQGDILVVSQFTLAGSFAKGNRPDYTSAADPLLAEELYKHFVAHLQQTVSHVQTGRFGAMMHVSLTNEGPVTLLLERT